MELGDARQPQGRRGAQQPPGRRKNRRPVADTATHESKEDPVQSTAAAAPAAQFMQALRLGNRETESAGGAEDAKLPAAEDVKVPAAARFMQALQMESPRRKVTQQIDSLQEDHSRELKEVEGAAQATSAELAEALQTVSMQQQQRAAAEQAELERAVTSQKEIQRLRAELDDAGEQLAQAEYEAENELQKLQVELRRAEEAAAAKVVQLEQDLSAMEEQLSTERVQYRRRWQQYSNHRRAARPNKAGANEGPEEGLSGLEPGALDDEAAVAEQLQRMVEQNEELVAELKCVQDTAASTAKEQELDGVRVQQQQKQLLAGLQAEVLELQEQLADAHSAIQQQLAAGYDSDELESTMRGVVNVAEGAAVELEDIMNSMERQHEERLKAEATRITQLKTELTESHIELKKASEQLAQAEYEAENELQKLQVELRRADEAAAAKVVQLEQSKAECNEVSKQAIITASAVHAEH